jgi:ESCRT-II complex subunit VPS36
MTGKETSEALESTNRPKPSNSVSRTTSTAMTGISGLTRHMEEKHKEVGASLQEAFKDMDSLFEKAREMVAIANRLASANRGTTSNQSEEQSHFQSDMMLMMGIRSPVTLGAHDSHDLYLEELSREVDTFVCNNFHFLKSKDQSTQRRKSTKQVSSPSSMDVSSPLAENPPKQVQIAHEVIPLVDLYCIFNRARGSALVSPADLLQACKRLIPLKLRCRLIELNDGSLAVASDQYDQKTITRQVGQILASGGPLSAVQLSSQQKIGLPLANYYLIQAECLELACRDHSSEGLIFWPNIFRTNGDSNVNN